MKVLFTKRNHTLHDSGQGVSMNTSKPSPSNLFLTWTLDSLPSILLLLFIYKTSVSTHFPYFTINKSIYITSPTQRCPHVRSWTIDLIWGAGLINGHEKYEPIKILPSRWSLPKQTHVTAVSGTKILFFSLTGISLFFNIVIYFFLFIFSEWSFDGGVLTY